MAERIELLITARDVTRQAFRTVDRELHKLHSSVSKLSVAFGALGAGISFKAVLDATIKQEAALAQLEARLKSTGGVAGLTRKELAKFAASLQQVTTYGDEAVIELEALLLTFTNIRGQVFRDATRAVLDMATAMGVDLKSAAIQVGKALNDPVQGMSALSRTGVQFTRAQKVLPGGISRLQTLVQPFPIYAIEGQGATIIDATVSSVTSMFFPELFVNVR